MFLALSYITQFEISRVGSRSAFRPKFILQIVEKLASAGLKGRQVRGVHREAARCLAIKNQYHEMAYTLSQENSKFDLLSQRSLLWLWRFYSRLSKAKESEDDGSLTTNSGIRSRRGYHQHRRWWEEFKDPSLPLVLDLGCGLGVSLLGLASLSSTEQAEFEQSPERQVLGKLCFANCNFLGADLSSLGIGFAKSITERWQLSGRLQFACLTAEKMMEDVQTYYRGHVALILIQFPTPFRFQGKNKGNTQLPSVTDKGFMVSEALLARSASLLLLSGGRLILQSNCEDVAVEIGDMATNQIGLEYVAAPRPVLPAAKCARLPLRSQQWLQLGGKRAVGAHWSSTSFLPPRGATETEAACQMQGTPIHRCMFAVKACDFPV